MPAITILLDDDHDNPEFQAASKRLQGRQIVKGEIAVVGALPKGMKGGRTSVYLSVELEDGRVGFCETSLALLQMATAAFTAKYGDESDGKTHEPKPGAN